MPVAAVSRLHTVVPIAISLVRCHLSLKWPMGSPTIAYIQINTLPKNPSAVSLNKNSLRIGSPSEPSNWRSKKFSRLMANSTKSANFAPVAALLRVVPAAWPAGGTPSRDCGLTDISSIPPENRRRRVVCRTSGPNAYKLAKRAARRRHVFPKSANFAARVVFELRRRTEDHGRTRFGVESRPRGYARIIGVPGSRECNPARGELIGHARRVIAVARLAE